jgi:superfamily II DNA or RNA helicase
MTQEHSPGQEPHPRPKKQLRPHQQEAYTAAVTTLGRRQRATVISATGSGKTLTAIRIAEHFAHHGSILVVVPSRALVEQTAARWREDSHLPPPLGVCSLTSDVMATTTSPGRIAAHLTSHDGGGVVITTYSSLPAIAKAHTAHNLPRWSLIVVDEAHRSSGSFGKQWAMVHDDEALPARRRLYMTATPRTWKLPDPKKGKNRRGTSKLTPAEPLASMDDATIYGPVVYQLGLAEAIDQGILADYRIVVPVVSDADLLETLQNQNPTPHHDGLRLSALQSALLRAMATHKVRRVISFHSRIAFADRFSDSLQDTVRDTASLTGIRNLWAYALHSQQPRHDRARCLTEFESIPLHGGRSSRFDGAVLSNVRVLGEGVDVPDADGVVFADPKRSSSDIIQALGRALRQTPGAGKTAVLIIPVYVGKKQTTEQALNSSHFKILWEVLNGLREHDTKIWRRLGGGHGVDKQEEDPACALLTNPERAAEVARVTALRAHQVDVGTWDRGWAAATGYFESRGHLDIPGDHISPSAFPLGMWLGLQRSLYHGGNLEPERAMALTTLNIAWPHPPHSFEGRLEQAAAFAEHHHTLAVATATRADDGPVIRWLHRQRALADSGRLHPYREDALKAVDVWWNPPWGVHWQQDYAHIDHLTSADSDERTPASQLTPHAWIDRQINHSDHLAPQQLRLLAALAEHHHPHALLLRRATSTRHRAFNRGLRAARQFHQREGHLDVPAGHREDLGGDRVRLAHWITRCRTRAAQLSWTQHHALLALGLDLAPLQAAAEDTDQTVGEAVDAWWQTPALGYLPERPAA